MNCSFVSSFVSSFVTFLVFLFLLFVGVSGQAAEMPTSWPWEGVTVNNLSFSPDQLSALKKDLPGVNSIRLTLLPRLTAKRKGMTPDQAWGDIAGWITRMLDACAKNGIVAIVSVHQFPVDPADGIKQNSTEFWSSSKHRDDVIKYVDRMASRFAGRGTELVAFEVLSEALVAVNHRARLPKEWPPLMRRIVSTIRRHSDKWIIVTPGPGGFPRGYKNFRPLADSRIVYGAHMYEPHRFALQGVKNRPLGYVYPGRIGVRYWDKNQIAKKFAPLRRFQKRYNVPVWIGEFSAARWARGGERYLLDIVDLCRSYGWGWAYFNIGGFHAWDPSYDSTYPTENKHPKKIGHRSKRWQTLRSVLGSQ